MRNLTYVSAVALTLVSGSAFAQTDRQDPMRAPDYASQTAVARNAPSPEWQRGPYPYYGGPAPLYEGRSAYEAPGYRYPGGTYTPQGEFAAQSAPPVQYTGGNGGYTNIP